MKKQLKKVMAMTLVCAMTLPTAVFASTAPTLSGNTPGASTSTPNASVSGSNDIDSADYKVVVPSDLNFAIDRFEISDKGQIYGVDYPIINGSPFAVKVDVAVVNQSKSTSVNLVADPASPKLASTTAADLQTAYMAAYIPSAITVANDAYGSVDGDTVSGNWTSVSENISKAINNAPATATKFGFKLAKYDGSAVSENNCATFSWTGKVNPKGKWEKNSIKVKASFEFSGLSKDGYDALGSISENNLIGSKPSAVQTISKANPQNVTFDLSSLNKASVTSVVFKGTGSNTQARTLATPAGYAYDTAKVLTIKGATGAFVNTFPVDTYTITVTFADNSTTNLSLKLTN